MRMGRRIPFAGLVVALVLVASASGQSQEEEKAAVDARIAALQGEIEAAKQQEGVLTSQLSAVLTELRKAQSAVEAAQGRLDELEATLVSERARLAELTALLQRQTHTLVRLQASYRRAVAILEARVRAAYMAEPPDVLSFLVSASSFGELIDNIEFLDRLGLQDQRIALQVRSAREKAAAERRATRRTRALQVATVSVIEARASEARDVRDHLAASRDTLTSVRGLRESALVGVRESREEDLAEVEALAAESAALAAAIRAAQDQSSSSGGGVPSAAGFIWPVDGAVVSGFGMRGGRMHEGIDITAASGTPIRAAAAGTVIWSGWRGGYGNAVVIDHGDGLATLYAHASALLVEVGQFVSQGTTVALVGSTGNSSGPHLHFEVRVNGSAVDPLLYL